MKSEILSLYPTEVMIGQFDESIVAPVAQELLTKADFESGGDLSDENLLGEAHDLPVLKKFFKDYGFRKFNEYTEQVFNHTLDQKEYKFKAWANNGAGRYSLGFHNHSGAQLSAVFYLLVEDSSKHGGKFLFHDPRFNANRGMTKAFAHKHQDFEMSPVSGGFVIFPSYLYHSVTTFYGRVRLFLPVDMFNKE